MNHFLSFNKPKWRRLIRLTSLTVACGASLLLIQSPCVEARVAAPVKAKIPVPHPRLGTNLTAVVDYTREWPFVNAFKVARPWISQGYGLPWGTGPALVLRSDGYPRYLLPGQWAETLIYDNAIGSSAASYPTGNYTLLYDGEGTISFDDGTASIVSQTSGSMVVSVPTANLGIYLKLTATNPLNPLRNIRFISPGCTLPANGIAFHPAFLAKIRGYAAFRFMEWMQTNTSQSVNWSDRPQVSDYTYSSRGVPLEVMIALANQTGASPWFNIPHQATNEYVRNFALIVKSQLRPDVNFYIEYSNETWNSIFSQTTYVQNQGLAFHLSTTPLLAGAYFTALRATQIFSIFQSVFNGSTARFTRVIASQAANPWLQDQTVSYRDAYMSADALAIAPYFSDCSDASIGGWGVLGDPSTAAQVDTMSVAQVLSAELEHVNNCANAEMTAASAVAAKYRLKLIGYEGGQSLVGIGSAQSDATMAGLFAGANRDPGMQQLYDAYLANWKNAGGDIFFHFTDVTAYSPYGNWGSMETQDQDPSTAPKFLSLMNYAAANP